MFPLCLWVFPRQDPRADQCSCNPHIQKIAHGQNISLHNLKYINICRKGITSLWERKTSRHSEKHFNIPHHLLLKLLPAALGFCPSHSFGLRLTANLGLTASLRFPHSLSQTAFKALGSAKQIQGPSEGAFPLDEPTLSETCNPQFERGYISGRLRTSPKVRGSGGMGPHALTRDGFSAGEEGGEWGKKNGLAVGLGLSAKRRLNDKNK